MAPPTNCGGTTTSTTTATTTSSGGSTGTTTSGGSSGAITINGGSVNTLSFAVVGDSRPGNLDDNSGYPTAIITQIYQDIASSGAQFVLATGDYQYATPTTMNGATQMASYVTAMSAFPGPVFPAMGNHECDGYTADNCDSSGNITSGGGGTSNNFLSYEQLLLAPIGATLPYYSFTVNVASPPSTAKFIFIAANAWDSTQESWLKTELARSTDYTFVIRHEPAEANTAPGVSPSESDLSAASYTVKIVGHVHVFAPPNTSGTTDAKEVCVGNGGASTQGDGYALFSIDPSTGNVVVKEIGSSSNSQVSTFTIPK